MDMSDQSTLGPNQKEWVKMQISMRKTHPFLVEVDEIPSEDALEQVKDCFVPDECFDAGLCLNPRDPRCPLRER